MAVQRGCGVSEGGGADRRLWRKKGGASPLNLWQVRAKFIFAKHAPKAKREKGEESEPSPYPPQGKTPFNKESIRIILT